jgi:hypothetical protein
MKCYNNPYLALIYLSPTESYWYRNPEDVEKHLSLLKDKPNVKVMMVANEYEFGKEVFLNPVKLTKPKNEPHLWISKQNVELILKNEGISDTNCEYAHSDCMWEKLYNLAGRGWNHTYCYFVNDKETYLGKMDIDLSVMGATDVGTLSFNVWQSHDENNNFIAQKVLKNEDDDGCILPMRLLTIKDSEFQKRIKDNTLGDLEADWINVANDHTGKITQGMDNVWLKNRRKRYYRD